MNPWMRKEPLGTEESGAAQFEGRTAEEAVARARAALGEADALRCWKTRRGGGGGVFAKEVFVAGLTPPPGSETTRNKASRRASDEARGGSDRDPVPRAAPYDGTSRAADHLSGLVEATSDQVSLRSLAIPAEAFDEVLAEAQAALTREREGNEVTIPRELEDPLPPTSATEEPSPSEPEPTLPDDGGAGDPPDRGEYAIAAGTPTTTDAADRPASGSAPPPAPPAKKASRPKPKARRTPPAPRSTTAAKQEQRRRPARIPDLRPGLRSLGVPDAYLPRGQRPSLDQLATVMGTLPVSPALPTRTGAVVAVVASAPNL